MRQQSHSLATSVAIFCDWQNVRATQEQLRALLAFACRLGTVVLKQVFAHWRRESIRAEQWLDALGFDCFNVPSSKHRKNAVDQKLIAHCRQQVLSNPAITTVILLSGDGDFKGLVRELKAKGKKVIVIGQYQNTTHRKLAQLADEFHLLSQLC